MEAVSTHDWKLTIAKYVKYLIHGELKGLEEM